MPPSPQSARRIFLGVFLACTLSLVLVKGWLRPRVLAAHSPDWLEVFVLSFPNFLEAVLGSFLVLGFVQTIHNRVVDPAKRRSGGALVLLTLLLAGLYVISQEMKLHNLGGNNVFDLNDVWFSVAGLVASALFFWRTRFELDWRAPPDS